MGDQRRLPGTSCEGKANVAICFQLVVNFGDNATAAQAAALIDSTPRTLGAGAHRLPLHRPLLTTHAGSYVELAIMPVAVGWGVALDGSLPRIPLSAAELSELGQQLYDLLAKFDGYVAAKVGWDPESLVDPAELKTERPEDLADGSIHGLVLCERLHRELGLGDEYVPFQPGYRWVPYQGERPSTLTAN